MFIIVFKILLTYCSFLVSSVFRAWLLPVGRGTLDEVQNKKATDWMAFIMLVLMVLCIWSY